MYFLVYRLVQLQLLNKRSGVRITDNKFYQKNITNYVTNKKKENKEKSKKKKKEGKEKKIWI